MGESWGGSEDGKGEEEESNLQQTTRSSVESQPRDGFGYEVDS